MNVNVKSIRKLLVSENKFLKVEIINEGRIIQEEYEIEEWKAINTYRFDKNRVIETFTYFVNENVETEEEVLESMRFVVKITEEQEENDDMPTINDLEPIFDGMDYRDFDSDMVEEIRYGDSNRREVQEYTKYYQSRVPAGIILEVASPWEIERMIEDGEELNDNEEIVTIAARIKPFSVWDYNDK